MDIRYLSMTEKLSDKLCNYTKSLGLDFTSRISYDSDVMTIVVFDSDRERYRRIAIDFSEVVDFDKAIDTVKEWIKNEFNSIYTGSFDVISLYPSFMPAKSNIDPVDSILYAHKLLQSRKTNNSMKIKNVIFNDPATIVFWKDGTKTVVKCQDGDEFDPEKGLAMAIVKKTLGNNGRWYNEIKKWLPKEKSISLECAKVGNAAIKGIQNAIDRATDEDISCINCTHVLEPVNTERCGGCANDPAHPNFEPKGE